MGDARLDYTSLTYGWFDHFLKGEDNGVLKTMPKVRYFTMGSNKWQSSETWPPQGAQPMTLYLSSGGKANSLNGDGVLSLRLRPRSAPINSSMTYEPRSLIWRQRVLYGKCITGGA
jgi:predicted acyl esterase